MNSTLSLPPQPPPTPTMSLAPSPPHLTFDVGKFSTSMFCTEPPTGLEVTMRAAMELDRSFAKTDRVGSPHTGFAPFGALTVAWNSPPNQGYLPSVDQPLFDTPPRSDPPASSAHYPTEPSSFLTYPSSKIKQEVEDVDHLKRLDGVLNSLYEKDDAMSQKSEDAEQRTACPYCPFTAESFNGLDDHITHDHADLMAGEDSNGDDEEANDPQKNRGPAKPKFLKCKQCDYSTIVKTDFWEHSRVHIKSEKLLSCPKCTFVTEYKHHLEYHLRNHFGSKPFKCNKCSYSCVNKSMLNSHLKSHSNIYQYRCADCAYATKYCHSLKLHLRKYNHQPAMVLNPDGSPNPLPVIDVYGTRRGPKLKKDENGMPKIPSHLLHQLQMHLGANQTSNLPGGNNIMSGFTADGKLNRYKVEEKKGTLPKGALKCSSCDFVSADRELFTKHLYKHAAEEEGAVEPSEDQQKSRSPKSRKSSTNSSHSSNNFHTSQGLISPVSMSGELPPAHPFLFPYKQQHSPNGSYPYNPKHSDAPLPFAPSVDYFKDLFPKMAPFLLNSQAGPLNILQQQLLSPGMLQRFQIPHFDQQHPFAVNEAVKLSSEVDHPASPKINSSAEDSSPENPSPMVHSFPLDLRKEMNEIVDRTIEEINSLPPNNNNNNNNVDKNLKNKRKRKAPAIRLDSITRRLQEQHQRIGGTPSPPDSTGEDDLHSPNSEEDDHHHIEHNSSRSSDRSNTPPESTKGLILKHSEDDITSKMSSEVFQTKHTSEGILYQCSYCDIAFKDIVMYTVHMGYHGYRDPFTCNMCGHKTHDKVAFFLHIARSSHL